MSAAYQPTVDPRQPAAFQVRNQYITDILTRLRYLSLWVDDPDQAMTLDPWVYEKIEREVTIEAARNFRRHKVAGSGKSIHIEADPADPRSGALVGPFQALLARLERFDTARSNLADAFFKGLTVGLLEGDWYEAVLPGDSMPRMWWFPLSLRDVDKRRVRQEYAPGTHQERWTIFDFERNEWQVIRPETAWHYVWHRYDTTERSLNYGVGIAQRLVYYWTVKTVLWETSVRGAERWGFGWVVAKLSGLLGGASTTNIETYGAKVNALITQLEKQREKHVFVHDKEAVELEVLEPTGTGHEMLERLMRYCDEQIRIMILGAVLPTGGGSDVGSNARAETEADSTEALLEYDRSILAETLTRGLLGAIRRCNAANLAAMGYGPDVAMPRFAIRHDRAPNFKERAEVVQILRASGVPLRASEVYEQTGFTAPDPSNPADTLAPPAPVPAVPVTGGQVDPSGYDPFAPAPFLAAVRDELAAVRADLRATGA